MVSFILERDLLRLNGSLLGFQWASKNDLLGCLFRKSLILLAPRTGIEPVTCPLGGGRAIHCATEALAKI